jgi:hypothetical protein
VGLGVDSRRSEVVPATPAVVPFQQLLTCGAVVSGAFCAVLTSSIFCCTGGMYGGHYIALSKVEEVVLQDVAALRSYHSAHNGAGSGGSDGPGAAAEAGAGTEGTSSVPLSLQEFISTACAGASAGNDCAMSLCCGGNCGFARSCGKPTKSGILGILCWAPKHECSAH